MNSLNNQEDQSLYMCVSQDCQSPCIFGKKELNQHEQHTAEYFDIHQTISKIQDSQNKLNDILAAEDKELIKLKEEVLIKEKDIEILNGAINNNRALIKSLEQKSAIEVKQNLLLLNKIRYDQLDIDYQHLYESKLQFKTMNLEKTSILRVPIFEYPYFQGVFKQLSLQKFKKSQINCQQHPVKQIEYLFLDQNMDLGKRAGCSNCQGERRYSLMHCKDFIQQQVDQEKMLEKIITLARNVKKFRNLINQTLRHFTTLLDLEIKKAKSLLLERQQGFNLMLPQGGGDFQLKNYQQIAQMLSIHVRSSGAKGEIQNIFSKNQLNDKIDEVIKYIENISTNYKSFTEKETIYKLFTEQEEKLRMTLEVVRKRSGVNEAKISKGYELMVPRNQKVSSLIDWVKSEEGLPQDTVVRVSLNYVIYDFNYQSTWQDRNIQNGAIIHVIFE